MFINLPTITELRNLQLWSSEVLGVAVALWVVSCAITQGLDWLADRDIRREQRIVDAQAERRLLQAVMARETR